MKIKSIFCIILVFIGLGFFGACVTPPPPEPVPEALPPPPPPPPTVVTETLLPLTTSIVQRLGDSTSGNIGDYQLLLFGRIFMEREDHIPSQTLVNGKVEFQDVHERVQVTINDQTEGQAIAIRNAGNETVLSVCFENDDSLALTFSTSSQEPDGYFYLVHDPKSASVIGDEKGTIKYGGKDYKIRYTVDKRPYLLIKLSQTDIERVNSRTATGRSVVK